MIRHTILMHLIIFACAGCDRPQDHLVGQSNVRITFYGMAVDESGQPLEGASFSVISESFPKDWTFDTRDRPHERQTFRARTDANGRFELDLVTRGIFIGHASKTGYRHFTAELGETSNLGIMISAWSQQIYKSDPDRPAIFVFVKDGAKEVSALPSRGGYEAYGQQWIPNEPKWPREPSLKDVVYVPPATQPSTQPVTE